MRWYDNEDAGDLSAMGAADYSGHLGEMEADKVSHLVGRACGDCGEPMTDPVIVDEGTRMEDYACRGECAASCAYEEVVDYPHGEDGGYWGVGAE